MKKKIFHLTLTKPVKIKCCEILSWDMDISNGKVHLHSLLVHTSNSFLESLLSNCRHELKPLVTIFCWQCLTSFSLSVSQPHKNHPMNVSGACAHACMSVSVCVSVWEALDIKVNFNKVWRLASGIGETCQAQTLSLCVPSHPVFTSSGQLAAFSVCWTSWQSHIFTIWVLYKH